ncbi:NHL domain-containing protein [Cucumis melo var. makuwa]|uniref:NHL domain-containing protein n=1 Tax=Cucumis melo var. makuwa TaxID=1194695 RepID=A0A5A7T213_CUCMM|nr:NHL domain-containing protein [Cucumis melo var. makuwa]TYK01979.1 NHL domain-containing protein [Cucumis melo var. makuwa]
MARIWVAFALVFLLLFGGVSSVSATPPAKIVRGVLSNVVSSLVKKLWSMKSSAKTAVSSRSMMKFESGYTVETVFDGSKLGIDPYSVEVSPSGELLILDAENSNIHKISMPLSRFSRPKLVSGSAEGYSGHVDGHPREARMNHPKGLTLDERGNIYIADTMNMAIRKISDTGVTTIAGGRWNQGSGHIDGPSEDAKFSNDFDVVYVGSSCSLLVIDRGNKAIREIELNYDDCNTQYADSLNLGVVLLVAAGLFGYLLALLQRRVQAMFSSQKDQDVRSQQMMKATPVAPYQRPPLKSVRPSLIPSEDEPEKLEEGFFGSLGRLFVNSGSSMADIFGGLLSGFRRKPLNHQIHQQFQPVNRHPNAWPLQESFVIPDEDEPPSIETKTPTIKKTYPFMTQDLDRSHQFKPNRSYFSGWDGPTTYYEKSCETNEIVFGAVQEQDGRREAMVIKAVDYGDPRYNHHNIRARYNYTGNPNSY